MGPPDEAHRARYWSTKGLGTCAKCLPTTMIRVDSAILVCHLQVMFSSYPTKLLQS